MGYYVIMNDIEQAQEEIAGKLDEWEIQRKQMAAVLANYCTDLQERCSGEVVDSICCYINEVHQYLLERFEILFVEVFERIVCYAEGYYELEEDISTGEIAQESLENQKTVLQNGKENFFLEAEALETNLGKISDIISTDAPSTTTVESGFRELTKYADDLLNAIGEYEEKHKSEDFEIMVEMMDSLSGLIENLSGKKQVEIGEYKCEDIQKHPEVERLKDAEQKFGSVRKNDTKRLEIVEEYLLQQQIEARKKQGYLKIFNGVALVVGVAATVAVVVGSWGGATPIVTSLWGKILFGGSSVMTTVYGTSESIEGINLYQLGAEGDVQTVAGNPVRDIAFRGNEELYQQWGGTNVFISQFVVGGSGLLNLAKSQGYNAALLEVGKIAGREMAGDMTYQYMVEELGMSETEAMLLAMVTADVAYGGLNLLHGNVLSRRKVNTVTLKHRATSGVELKSTAGKTTTVLGRYGSDTGQIITELNIPKNTDFSGNPGGFNLLNTPDEYYITAEQFWNEYNKPFLDAAIERRDEILMATPINNSTLYTKSGDLTGYGREYFYLLSKGYVYVNGKMILKGVN